MKPLPRQILLGVVGPGAEWETQYAPILNAVARKVRVVARYRYPQGRLIPKDGGTGLSATGGSDYGSLRRFFSQPGLRGAIVMGAAWSGRFAAQLAVDAGCSAYFSVPPIDDLEFLATAARIEQETGLLLMPEFRLRFTPATLRLRELIATQLGPVDSIQIELSPTYRGEVQGALLELIDWCFMLWPSPIEQVQMLPTAPTSESSTSPEGHRTVRLQWAKPGSQGEARIASVTLPEIDPAAIHNVERREANPKHSVPIRSIDTTAADSWPLTIHVTSKQGTATIHDACHIDWTVGDETATESLRTDRTAVEVSLDLFTRRLAGGLVPVPTLADLTRSLTLCRQLQ